MLKVVPIETTLVKFYKNSSVRTVSSTFTLMWPSLFSDFFALAAFDSERSTLTPCLICYHLYSLFMINTDTSHRCLNSSHSYHFQQNFNFLSPPQNPNLVSLALSFQIAISLPEITHRDKKNLATYWFGFLSSHYLELGIPSTDFLVSFFPHPPTPDTLF